MEKKRRQKKKLWVVFVFTMLLSLAVPAAALAAGTWQQDENKLESYVSTTENGKEMSGIAVSSQMDQTSYRDGDTAAMTLTVKNNNSYAVSDVDIHYNLPGNFSVKSGKTSETIKKLNAGETKQLKIQIQVTPDSSGKMTSRAVKGLAVSIVSGVLLVAAIIFLIFKKRKIKKLLSMFLVCVLAVNSAWFGQTDKVQAEVTNETGNYKVSGDDYINRVSVHDPSVVKDKKTGMYYVFGSHLACAKSKDLKQWEYVYTNIKDDYKKLFKEPWDGWAKKATNPKDGLSGRMWAPDVVWNETMQKWCMYMSIDGDNWVSSICLLTADKIEGPYEYKGVVVYSGMNNPKVKMDLSNTDVYKVLGEGADLSRYQSTNESCINAIDPSIQTDDKGNMYMTYGSWSAGIYQIKLDLSTGLRDYGKTYETKLNESDAYYGVKIAGGFYCSGEGPYILKGKDYYYLFVSYGNLEAKGGYQMRVYRSKEVTGPYLDDNGVSAIRTKAEEIKKTRYGYRIFDSYNMEGIGTVEVAQGHNSAMVDDDGKMYLVYHTRFQSDSGTNEGHQIRVHQIFENDNGWPVAAPYEYSGETLSQEGYTMEDMAGTYEFIYHEPTSSYNVVGDRQFGIVGKTESTRKIQGRQTVAVGMYETEFSYEVEFTKKAADTITLKPDGTVTGEYHGTWKKDGSKITLDLGSGHVYKGVFLKQANELMSRDMTMTFTAEGENVAVWGVKVTDKKEK